MLASLLTPVVQLMDMLLNLYLKILSSAGLSILLLSLTFSLLLMKPRQWAEKIERRVSAKKALVDEQVRALDSDLKGEERFDATEKIYQENDYHPIETIAAGASFIIMLPVLLSAYFLFTGDGYLVGHSFLIIKDLAQPDGALGEVNLLPFIMAFVIVFDARLRYVDDRKARDRFYVLSLILLALVYNLPAGLVLYWTGSSVTALLLALVRPSRSKSAQQT